MAQRGPRVRRHSGVELTFANSTSFAFHDVVNTIRNSRVNALFKDTYRIEMEALWARRASGGLSGDELRLLSVAALTKLNRVRSRLGFPPIDASSPYLRNFKLRSTVISRNP